MSGSSGVQRRLNRRVSFDERLQYVAQSAFGGNAADNVEVSGNDDSLAPVPSICVIGILAEHTTMDRIVLEPPHRGSQLFGAGVELAAAGEFDDLWKRADASSDDRRAVLKGLDDHDAERLEADGRNDERERVGIEPRQ